MTFPGVGITVSPATVTVPVTGQVQFAASITGSLNKAVSWAVNGTSGGSATLGVISSSGQYVAPASVPNPSAVTVTATSQADNTKSSTATVTIVPKSDTHTVSVAGGQVSGGVDINVSHKTPTLQITMVGTAGKIAHSTGTSVSRGSSVTLFLVGSGLVIGTTYSISGPSDVTVTQPSGNDFGHTTENAPAVNIPITVSVSAAPGSRNIIVKNGTGETAIFPGGLLITP